MDRTDETEIKHLVKTLLTTLLASTGLKPLNTDVTVAKGVAHVNLVLAVKDIAPAVQNLPNQIDR